MRNRHNLGNRPLVVAVLAATVVAVLAVLFTGCGRAEAQAAAPVRLVQLPPGAVTLCGLNNTQYPVRQDVRLTDLSSGLLRYGPCYNVACAGERKCITGESPRAVIQEWMIWRMVGCSLDPGEFVTHTGIGEVRWSSVDGPAGVGTFTTTQWEEQIEDAGLTGQSPKMQVEQARACARPTPTPAATPTPRPSPTATATPVEPRPTPTLGPWTQIPPALPTDINCRAVGCNPTIPTPKPCPTYAPVEEPGYVRETIAAGLERLGRRFREKVEMTKRWRAEHPGPYYTLLSSGRISQSVEPCRDIGAGCWQCDELSAPVCVGAAP